MEVEPVTSLNIPKGSKLALFEFRGGFQVHPPCVFHLGFAEVYVCLRNVHRLFENKKTGIYNLRILEMFCISVLRILGETRKRP